jgi:autotransporter-associated beta strand protein
MSTSRPSLVKRSLVTTSLLLTGCLGSSLYGATSTWLGGTSNLWNTASNWSGAAVPTSGSTLFFGAPGSSGVALSDDITSLTVGGAGTDGIVFGLSAPGYAITRPGSQTITFGSSAGGIAIKDLSLFAQSMTVAGTMTTAQTIQVGDTSGASLSSLTLGALNGGNRLTKTGSGVLALSTSSLGGLTVNQGTVNVGSDAQLSSVAPVTATANWIELNGGTLRANVNAAWTLNANRGIALGDGTAGSGGTMNVYVTNASAANTFALTYNGIIANNGGSNSLTKTGNQILSLGGANTYTGATRINQGTLQLNFAAGTAPTDNIINSASSLVMGDYATSLANTAAGNPILLVQGANTGSNSQTFNGANFLQGNSSVVVRAGNSATSTTLNLGPVSHNTGGTVGFSLLTGGSTGAGVVNAAGTSNTNGILGGWATTAAVGSGTTPLTQTDWATVDGNGNIVAYTGYTTPAGATPTLANNAASNVRITNGSTGNISLTFATNVSDLNTIQTTDTVGRTIAVGAGNTLRLGNYGGVWTAGSSAGTLTIGASVAAGGTLTAGGAANTAGEIVFNAGSALMTVNSAIANNGTGAVSLVKTGTGSLTLNGTNSYSGGTYINQGIVNATNGSAFGGAGRDVSVLAGAQVVTASGGGLTYANNFNLAGSALTLGGVFSGGVITTVGNTVSGTVTLKGDTSIGSSATAGTISGKITGDYNLSNIGHLTLSNTANDFSGNLGINGITGALGANAATLRLGANEVISNGAGKGNVYISGGSGGLATLDLNGKTETINGLVSVGVVANVRVTNTAATAATLILGDNDQTATFAGAIVDGAGSVAITKIGAGNQTLSGTNTYTGATTISAGTLVLASSAVNSTIAGSSTIDVQANGRLDVTGITTVGGFIVGNGQTIKGNGTVVGATTIAAGANLAPGSSPGNLTFTNGLTLAGNYNWELGALSTSSPGINFDLVTITGGNVDLTGSTITLTLGAFAPTNVAFWQANQTWTGIVDNTGAGSLTGNFGAIDNSPWSSLGSFSTVVVGNDVNLVWTAVPEPSTGLLLAGGLVAVALRRRR